MVSMAFELGKTYLDNWGEESTPTTWLHYGDSSSPTVVQNVENADAFNANGNHYNLDGTMIGNGSPLIDDRAMTTKDAVNHWTQVLINIFNNNPIDKVQLVIKGVARIGKRLNDLLDPTAHI